MQPIDAIVEAPFVKKRSSLLSGPDTHTPAEPPVNVPLHIISTVILLSSYFLGNLH